MAKRFQKVAVLMGGPSKEREVSLRSGQAVARGLKEAGYQVEEMAVANRVLDVPRGTEAVFIALHGEFGEDGEVQDLLGRKGIPYTGSDAQSSRLAFDKTAAKRCLEKHGLPTPRYQVLHSPGERLLDLPVVTKPVRQGSSIGVHRVFQDSEWEEAVRDTLSYGGEALVETYIPGKELTVGILGDMALPVIEIVAPDDWYSYTAKYTKGKTEYLVPAPIRDEIRATCQDMALRTFRALGCRALARVDFRCSDDGQLSILELNSIPGFTETSLLPKAAAVAGIRFPELCERIMETATTG